MFALSILVQAVKQQGELGFSGMVVL